ncbi:MAG TPA: CYTH domain-containing protein [Nevskiaceae bacterium]|nr:CYTH domain-containing protein [Nevskiaceae bacterium]
MGLEIERKFLLRDEAWRAEVRRSRRLAQGYLADTGGPASVRVRIQGEEARLNIKAAVVGAARAEYDYPLPLADAEQILGGLCVGRVEKTRHYVERDGLTWEIDEFHGDNAGLVVAEVELGAVDQRIVHPPWLGEEVTEDVRYYNHSLALRPYAQW